MAIATAEDRREPPRDQAGVTPPDRRDILGLSFLASRRAGTHKSPHRVRTASQCHGECRVYGVSA